MKKTASIHILSLFLLWGISACNDCPAIDTGRGFICDGTAATADIEPGFGLPVVSAALGDKPVRVLIDTGSDTTIVSSTLLHSEDAASIRLSDPLCIKDGFCLEKIPVYAWDTNFSVPDEDGINIILGMDLLRYFTLEIKKGQTVGLYFKSAPCHSEDAVVPLLYNKQRTPVADVRLDGTSIENVLLDTGAATCLLSAETADLLSPYFYENAVEDHGCTAMDCTVDGVFLSSVQRFCIDDQCEESVPTKFPVWNAVGNSFFFTRNLRFDFVEDELYFCSEMPD